MLRVSQLYLSNIGPFEKEQFDFLVEENHPDVHIFTGPNGSGKTSMLHAIASSFDFFENNHKEHTSNLFFKRFHKFQEDSKEMAISYAHCILRDLKKGKVVDKVVVYGCKKCGNIHQSYEKTVNNSSAVYKKGNGYQWEPHSKTLINYKAAIVSK